MEIQRQSEAFAYRLAMPAPLPQNITFKYHPDDSTIEGTMAEGVFYAPAVSAHIGNDPDHIGYISWFGDDYLDPDEVSMIEVDPHYRRSGVATALFDHAKKMNPKVHHSTDQTDLGHSWSDYEQSRKTKAANTIRCASDDDLILYHGTGADSVPHIQQNGLMHPPGVSPAGWPMLTTDFDQAKAYATRDNPVVLEYHVPANLTYGRWRTHRSGEEPYLWDAEPHTAYDYPAQSYALKRPLPATFLRAIHPVQRKLASRNTIRCATDDYRGYHRGPDADYGSSMDNPDGVFPDIDTHPEYYDTYQPYDYESHHQIRRVRGKPDSWVTVYRALPLSVLQHKTYRGGPNDLYEGSKPYSYRQREAPINTNDWVTPSYSYAQEHGEANLSNEPWTIVQQRVRARSLFSEGNSIHEWAYNGEPIVGTEGDRARRERGLRTRKTKRGNTIRCAMPMMYHRTEPEWAKSIYEDKEFGGPNSVGA